MPMYYILAGDYFQVCRRKDPNLGECIKNSITAAKPLLTKGTYFVMQIIITLHQITPLWCDEDLLRNMIIFSFEKHKSSCKSKCIIAILISKFREIALSKNSLNIYAYQIWFYFPNFVERYTFMSKSIIVFLLYSGLEKYLFEMFSYEIEVRLDQKYYNNNLTG